MEIGLLAIGAGLAVGLAGLGTGYAQGVKWQEVWVERQPGSPPRLKCSGKVEAFCRKLGVKKWHLSLTHDAGLATAMVVLEG